MSEKDWANGAGGCCPTNYCFPGRGVATNSDGHKDEWGWKRAVQFANKTPQKSGDDGPGTTRAIGFDQWLLPGGGGARCMQNSDCASGYCQYKTKSKTGAENSCSSYVADIDSGDACVDDAQCKSAKCLRGVVQVCHDGNCSFTNDGIFNNKCA